MDKSNIEVDEVERDREGNYRVTIHSTERGTHCHQCGHFIDHFYGHGEFIIPNTTKNLLYDTAGIMPIFCRASMIKFR